MVVEEVPQRTLSESSWLVTLDREPTDRGALYAQRFHEGKLERELLDANGYVVPDWSPDGQALTYLVNESELWNRGRVPTSRWLRRLDDSGWHELQLVHGPDAEEKWQGTTWSPSGDAFVFQIRRSDDGHDVNLGVLRDDGAVEVHTLATTAAGASVRGDWLPSGGRIAVAVGDGKSSTITIHEVQRGRAGTSVASRPLAAPEGLTFAGSLFDGTAISRDGQWLVVTVRALEAPLLRPYVLPLSGEGSAQAVPQCGLDPGETSCEGWMWHPNAPALVFKRTTKATPSVTTFFPQTETELSLGAGVPYRWLRGTAKLVVHDKSNWALIDMTDPTSPLRVELSDGDSSTILDVAASPDGRWLLLGHWKSGTTWWTALDLRTPYPWAATEVFRTTGAFTTIGVEWAPSSDFVLFTERTTTKTKATRIELPTYSARSLEFELGPTPSGFTWSGHFNPADGTLAIPHRGHLALLPPADWSEAALAPAPLGDTPDWSLPSWSPANVRH